MMYGNDWGWGVMMVMPLVWITLLGVVIWAVVQLTRDHHDRDRVDSGEGHREGPQEILDRRLASGEIDVETYVQSRDHLAGREPRSS